MQRKAYEFDIFSSLNIHGRNNMMILAGDHLENNGSDHWNYNFNKNKDLHEFTKEFEDDNDIPHEVVIEGETERGIGTTDRVIYAAIETHPQDYEPDDEMDELKNALEEAEDTMSDKAKWSYYKP